MVLFFYSRFLNYVNIIYFIILLKINVNKILKTIIFVSSIKKNRHKKYLQFYLSKKLQNIKMYIIYIFYLKLEIVIKSQ